MIMTLIKDHISSPTLWPEKFSFPSAFKRHASLSLTQNPVSIGRVWGDLDGRYESVPVTRVRHARVDAQIICNHVLVCIITSIRSLIYQFNNPY